MPESLVLYQIYRSHLLVSRTFQDGLGDETGRMMREEGHHAAGYGWRIVEPRVEAGALLGLDQSPVTRAIIEQVLSLVALVAQLEKTWKHENRRCTRDQTWA